MNLNWLIEIDKDSIDRLQFDFPRENTFWQSKWWVKTILKSWNAKKVFLLPHYDGILHLHKAIIVEKREVSMWEFWLFVIWLNRDINDYEDSLVDLCKKENCLFVQIEDLDYEGPSAMDCRFMRSWCYKKFIEPYTAVIDLHKSKEEILAWMKQKWRYNIKRAEKNGVVVKKVKPKDEYIEDFYSLLSETTSRNWFSQNSITYYKKLLKKVHWAHLYLAYYDWKAIAWWIFVKSDETFIYYYWASSSDAKYRNLMAPYLLQWTAILDAKKSWCKIYDFLWVSKPWKKHDKLSWVTSFKSKFTSDIRFVSDSYIYVNKKMKYYLIMFLKLLKSFKK